MLKILITGSTGLVGRNIVEKLYDRFELFTPNRRQLDLLKYQDALNYFKSVRPDIIIHCAGIVGGIQANINSPVKFLSENSYIGLNVINAAYAAEVKKVINIASSCMYPRYGENPLKEEMILQGELEPTNEGYAISKILSTRLCEYYSREYGYLHYRTIIPCNLYGKYDKFDPICSHMIPSVIHKTHLAKTNNEDKIEVWGSGTARREFMYAGDLADFVDYCLDKLEYMPSVLNVGTGEDYSVNEYYEVIAKVIGFNGKYIHNLSKPEGMKRKIVDIKKLINFGWTYRTPLKTGIEKTYRYYLSMEKN